LLETAYISCTLCPGILEEDLSSAILFDLLEKKFNLRLNKGKIYIEPVLASDYEASVLRIKPGAPVLLLERLVFTGNGQPVLFARQVVRGDRCRYFLQVT